MSSTYRVPLAPVPSTPIAREVTLLRLPVTFERSIFQGIQATLATSPALPLYATLVLLIFTYNCPPLPATPWNHSDRLLTPLAVQSCGWSKVHTASERFGPLVLSVM